jgi:deoxyribonuclease V
VQVRHFHSWDVTPQEAIQIQQQLRAKVVPHGKVGAPNLIAGADTAFVGDIAHACVVVLSFPKLEIVETVVHKERVSFPYIPGLLSFRETPALAQAFGKLQHEPDLIFIDGQGLAHPRAAGIACHIGVILDRPTIGCAKSLLFGTYKEPKQARGSVADLRDDEGRVIGAVVRTRDGVQPVYVSIGHRIDLAQAIELTLACGKGYRIPEPTRQADLLAARAKHGVVPEVEQGKQGELVG